MQSLHLKNRTYSVENLPSQPALLVELLDLCHDDNASFEMFSAAIEKDASLSARILQVANTPAYRQWNEINDIRRMLIVLGLINVRHIVTTCAIQQFFAQFTSNFDRSVQLTWLRSLLCANLAERLAKLTGYQKPGEAFLGGLLHQVGILMFLLNREEEYQPVIDHYYQHPEHFHRLERDKFQTDHCELGGALVASWELDSFIADAIQFQWAPADELTSSPILMKLLAVASPLSSSNSARNHQGHLQRAGQLLGLTEETILDCLDVAQQKSRQMITDLGFSGHFYLEEDEGNFFAEEQNQTHSGQLRERLKNLALSNTIGRSATTESLAFAKEVRASLNVIFNIDQLFLFTVNADRKQLVAVNDLGLNQLDEIQFSSDDQQSLLVKSFRSQHKLSSFAAQGSIGDRQVLRLLGSEGAFFQPLLHQGESLGVLVIGTTAEDLALLEARDPLLKLLAKEIARKYFATGTDEAASTGMSLVEFRKVAHEVSNPLTIINNYLYTLSKKIAEDHPAQEEISFISEEIERAGQILLRAKDPQSATQDKGRLLDINRLISELDKLFRGSLLQQKQISCALNLDPNIPAIRCPGDKLKQVLLNLIKNAVEALPEQGHLDISTRDNYYQNGDPYVNITIQDNGPGIAPKILDNLFQPVTSTKEGHAGLGLSIVGNLVNEMEGHISCHSRQDQGTEFTILLPRHLESPTGKDER